MKCVRKTFGKHYQWAHGQKLAREYHRKFWRLTCPFKERRTLRGRAIKMVQLAQYRAWKNQCVPKEYWSTTSFYNFFIERG